MKTTKLPFKKYTDMNNTLIAKLGCADVYRAYVLSLTADIKNNSTDTTLEQLAGFINEKVGAYKGNKTAKSFSESLNATGVVSVNSSRSTSLNGEKSVTRNVYTFLKGTEFRMIGVEFYNVDLDIKLKGYLIKLFSICNTNTLLLDKGVSEIYKLIGVTKATQKKYNDVLISKGFMTITDNGLLLSVSGFNKVEKKIKPTKETIALFEAHKNIIHSHIKAYNTGKQHKHQIIELNRKALDILLTNGLSKKSYIIGLYAINNFEGVNDINKLIASIEFGKVKVDRTSDYQFTI